MLFAGMATRAFCALATSIQERLIQRKATSDNPCRKISLRFIRIVWVAIFMSRSFQRVLRQIGKLAEFKETLGFCQLK
jgi:hypothetical protein